MKDDISPTTEKDNRGLNKTRLEAFCDGVFAIAITLLILEVKIPKHDDLILYGGLRPYLVQLWPNYFAYAFSFLVIGIWWSNHHYLSRLFTHTDHYFSMLTIGFLMSIAFLPFPAALLGDFISDTKHHSTAIAFYIFAGLLLPSIFWNLMWRYGIYKNRLIDKRLKESFIKGLTRMYFISLIIITSVLVLSFFFPIISFLIMIAVNLFFLKAPKKPEYANT